MAEPLRLILRPSIAEVALIQRRRVPDYPPLITQWLELAPLMPANGGYHRVPFDGSDFLSGVPRVYEDLGIDTSDLGCIMLDTDPIRSQQRHRGRGPLSRSRRRVRSKNHQRGHPC